MLFLYTTLFRSFLIGIVEKSGLPAVIVGDNWQSIYGFRGAEDAMSYFDGDVYSLSQSFRFGPKIAQVANQILRQSLDQPEIPLLGFEPQKSAVFEYQGKVKQRSKIGRASCRERVCQYV